MIRVWKVGNTWESGEHLGISLVQLAKGERSEIQPTNMVKHGNLVIVVKYDDLNSKHGDLSQIAKFVNIIKTQIDLDFW